VPTLVGIDIPHVLKAEVIGDLSGRQEGVEAEVAGQEGKAVEGDRVELRLIGDSLVDGVAFRVVATLRPLQSEGVRRSHV